MPSTLAYPPFSLPDRALGAYVGLAVGDALGATVEFMTAREIQSEYGTHRAIIGGGWLRLKPGDVTDDTQMCLALGRALLAQPEWSPRAAADALLGWMRSRPVDIGHTCRRGLCRYALDGTLSTAPSQDSGGNGAAVRNLPVALSTLGDDNALVHRSLEQAHITHNHPYSDAATITLGRMTHLLLEGGGREACHTLATALVERVPAFRFEPWPGNTGGYIVDTFQTALDAFFSASRFDECVIRAVNRGGDADTIGALAGQLAGACHGLHAIPAAWIRRLNPRVKAEIQEQTTALLDQAGVAAPGPTPP